MTLLLGRATAGTTADFSSAGNTAVWKFVAAASGDLRSIWGHTKVANTATQVRLGIYADDGTGTNPAALLGVATAVLAPANSINPHFAVLGTPVPIVAGTTYWLGWIGVGDSRNFQGDAGGDYIESGASNFQNPWPGGAHSSVNAVIWGEDIVPAQIIATSVLADTAAGTNHNVPYPTTPGGILAGDRLLVFVGQDSGASGSIGFPADGTWLELADVRDPTNAVNAACARKVCAGGETGTFVVTTSASEGGGIRCHLIRGGDPATEPDFAFASGSSTNPNPPPNNPGAWNIEKTLWIAAAMNDGNVAITAGPAGYSDFANTRWANTAGAGVATAWRYNEAVSEDPGTFTMATEQWVAFTIGIRPAVVAGDAIAPIVNLTSPLTQRVSDEPGKDSYSYSFSVNEDIQAWKVKVVASTSDPHTAGTQIDSGGAVSNGTVINGSITYAELVAAGVGAEGDKRLAVFAQDTAGNWSVTT